MGIRTPKTESWLPWLWRHQSPKLHDTGCQKSAFGGPSQESSFHGIPICMWLREHNQRGFEKNNIMVDSLLYKPWILVPCSREIARSFWNSIYFTTSSDQGITRRNCHDARVGKSSWSFCEAERCTTGNHYGKGWDAARVLVLKGNPGRRKNKPFFDHCSNDNSSGNSNNIWPRRRRSWRTDRVRLEQWRGNWDWRRRFCRRGQLFGKSASYSRCRLSSRCNIPIWSSSTV